MAAHVTSIVLLALVQSNTAFVIAGVRGPSRSLRSGFARQQQDADGAACIKLEGPDAKQCVHKWISNRWLHHALCAH